MAQASPAPAASPAASPSPTPTPIPHAFSISGFGDTGYTSASNASSANTGTGPLSDPNGKLITGRVFDNDNNQIMFHNWNLQAAYAPPTGFGGKVEYSFGTDADVIHSYPQSLQNPGNEIDLTQAYGSYANGPLTVQVGKFETLAGAEVIESPSDLNFSRSILFGYAVPFTHTGGRVTYAVNGDLNVIVGANQGWDTTKAISANGDVNALTAEYGIQWTPGKIFSAVVDGYTGPVEQGSANVGAGQPIRTLTDVVLNYHYSSALTLTLNVDVAQQNRTNVFGRNGAYLGVGNVSWNGAAFYASYTKGLWTLTGRGEYFADNGGSRTCTVATITAPAGCATRDVAEGTGTLAYAPNSNLIFRAEYRYDASTNQYFLSGASVPSFNNGGFGLEAIVKWP